jgi:hypothetical protein
MKEFMLLLRSESDHLSALSPHELQKHLEKVTKYIDDLTKSGRLKSAQPLGEQSIVISGVKGKLKDGPFNESKEVIIGYYLILARDIEEAVEIGKRNPNFDLDTSTRIEVRPIMFLDESINRPTS